MVYLVAISNTSTLRTRADIKSLLGKWRSKRNDAKAFKVRGFALSGHVFECLDLTKFILDDGSSGLGFGRKLFDMMDLDRFLPYVEFRKICILAVLAHDLGKSGQVFQTMLWNLEHDFKTWQQDLETDPLAKCPHTEYFQQFRHEYLSLHLLRKHPELSKWFKDQSGQYFDIVCAAAFGHHRKTDKDSGDARGMTEVYLNEMTLGMAIMVRNPLILGGFGFDAFPVCPDALVSAKQVDTTVDTFLDNQVETPVSMAVKWVTILGDVLGSITQSDGKVSDKTVREGLKTELRQIYAPVSVDYRKFASFLTNGQTPHPFQSESGLALGDLLLQISCGGGKTDAIYMWASARPDLKLIMTTPTTATASQHWLNGKCAELTGTKHSRSKLDVQTAATPGNGDDGELSEALNNFRGFRNLITYTTVDQLLGLLAFKHSSIMWLLYIVQAQVAFDEFHCYDGTMRMYFRQLLQWFPGLRCIATSATVSKQQRELFLTTRLSKPTFLTDTSSNSPSKRLRYRIEVITEAQARKHFIPGTLWIVNQVKIAQDLGTLYLDALVYHSRFRYGSRSLIQENLMRAFNPHMGAIKARAITTQAAEMSLDLSSTQLLSEIASIAALIQRLGRLNRLASPKGICTAYFYMPEKNLPYLEEDLVMAMKWLLKLVGRDLTQEDLSTAFDAVPDVCKTADFPGTLTRTLHSEVRDSNDYTKQGLLWRDAERIRKMPWADRNKALLEMEIPFLMKPNLVLDPPDPELKYRYWLPKNGFIYDPRLGLIQW